MLSDFTLTVKDVLERPFFQKAQLIAGREGLSRKIRWVHILEISNFETLLSGEEMILSTGVGLQWEPVSKTDFIIKLIEQNVSCLCIELGPYFDRIPNEMIEIANQYQLPLIIFKETVRFVDITHDLHSLIINRHHKILEKLEITSKKLHRISLNSEGITKMLDLLQDSTQAQIVFLPHRGQTMFSPRLNTPQQQQMIQSIERFRDKWENLEVDSHFIWNDDKRTFTIKPIVAMNQTLGFLVLMLSSRTPEEFDFLILDRASLSIAQDLLRKHYMEEKKLHSEHLWVDDLIHNRIHNEEQIKNLLTSQISDWSKLYFRLFSMEFHHVYETNWESSEEDLESVRMHIALFARTIFKQYSFHPLITTKSNQLNIIAIDLGKKDTHKDRLIKITDCIHTMVNDKRDTIQDLRIAIGRPYTQFLDAGKSYQETQHILRTFPFQTENSRLFYEDIGISRILFKLENEDVAYSFIDDYIGPIIDYDRHKQADLLLTLKTFFNCHCSKQLTAEALFIVRQTLYHRLDKIKQLIGEDFMAPEKRISIEVGIRAYEMYAKKTKLESGM